MPILGKSFSFRAAVVVLTAAAVTVPGGQALAAAPRAVAPGMPATVATATAATTAAATATTTTTTVIATAAIAATATAPVDVSPVKVAIAQAGTDGRSMWAVFGRGSDDRVWWREADAAATPDRWRPLSGRVGSGPDAVWTGRGQLLLATRSTSGSLLVRSFTTTSAGPSWSSLGGVITTAPVLTRTTDGTVGVFARGNDGALWYRLQRPGAAWSNWRTLGGRFTSAPDAEAAAPGAFLLRGRGTDGALWSLGLSTAGVPDDGWCRSEVFPSSAVSSVPIDDALDAMYYRDSARQLVEEINSTPVRHGGILTSAPDVTLPDRDGGRTVVVRGTDNGVWMWDDRGWHNLGGQVR